MSMITETIRNVFTPLVLTFLFQLALGYATRDKGFISFNSTRQIAESVEAVGMAENTDAAMTGGGIAKNARLDLEAKTGRKVVSRASYLPAPQDRKKLQ